MIEVEHEGTIHQFPDEATPEMIKKKLGQSSVKPGFEKYSPLFKMLAEHGGPVPRILSDVTTGLGEAGQNIASTLSEQKTPRYNIPKTFGGEEGSKLIQSLSQYSPGIAAGGASLPGQILSNMLYRGIQYQPGEENVLPMLPDSRGTAMLEAAMASAIPFAAKPGLDIVKQAPKSLGKIGFSKGNPLLKAEQALLESSIKGKKSSLETAAEKHAKEMGLEEEAKRLSEIETGRAKPSTMRHEIGETEKNIEEHERSLSDLNKQLEKHEELPELPKIDTESHDVNVKNAEKSLNKINQDIESLKENKVKSNELYESSESEVGNYVNSGEAHDEIVANALRPMIEELETTIPKNYSNFIEEIKNKNVQMPDDVIKIYDKSNKEIGELLKGRGSLKLTELDLLNKPRVTNETLDYILSHAPTSADKTAGVFLDKLKDLKEIVFSTKQAMRSEPLATRRTEMANAVKEAEKVIKNAEDALEKSLGSEDINRLKQINRSYREVLYPLRENPTARMVMQHTRMPEDIAKALRGTEPGNVILRNMIKEHPDALKGVIGQRYDSSKSKFYEKSPRLKEYTEQLPELKTLIERRNDAKSTLDKFDERINEAGKRKSEIEKEHKEAKSQKTVSEKEQKKIESEKSEREKTQQKLLSDMDKHKKYISDGNDRISKLNKHIEVLEKQSKQTKLSKEEVNSIKREITQLKEKLKETKQGVEKSKGWLLKATTKGYRIGKGVARALGKLGK